MGVVGQNTILKGAWEKVLGTAKYTSDIVLPGMLYGKILRSPYHHARIVHIDVSRAQRLPGVRAVITGRDIKPIKYGFWGSSGEHRIDMYVLAQDRVRFKGDEIAAVAAVDPDVAEEALDLIRVEYEELPAVFDVEEALAEGAPQLHDDAPGNVAEHLFFAKGDPDRAFAEADYIFEDRFVTHRVHQAYMEPAGCVAQWDPSGKLTIWIGNMNSSGLRLMLAKVLDLPVTRVRVIQPYTGGSFGSKVTLQSIYPVAAYLSKITGKPVKMINTREEEYFATRPHVNSVINVRTGVKADGTLLVREVDLINDAGAYCDMAPAMLLVMSHRSDSVYRLPNIRTNARLVYTNKSPIGAYRGYGNQQMSFAFESQLDAIAEKLGIDPVELRVKNATREGDVTVHGWEIKSCGLVECIERVASAIEWRKKRGTPGKLRGVGIGCAIHEGDDRHSDGFAGSNALVEVNEDGRVLVISGEGEFGQGAHTTFAQIAAEVLGVPVDQVDVTFPDTDRTPFSLGPWGSRITIGGGNAVRLAAEDARAQLLEVAADLLEVRPEDLDIKEGRIFVKGFEQRSVSVAEAAKTALYRKNGSLIRGKGTDEPHTTKMDPTKQTNPCSAYSFGAAAAEVEIDPQTGRVKVLQIVSCSDGGRIINPLNAEGQVQGQVVQGMGFVVQEEMKYVGGNIFNPGLLAAGTPRVTDVPPIDVQFAHTYDPYGPFGAKGVAEIALPPVVAAVANAISHALGTRIKELPITPEKVLQILEKGSNGGEGK